MLNPSPHDWPNRCRGCRNTIAFTDLLIRETEGSIGESIGQAVGIPASLVSKINRFWKHDIVTIIASEIPLIKNDVDDSEPFSGESILIRDFLSPQDVLKGTPNHLRTPCLLRTAGGTGQFIIPEVPFMYCIKAIPRAFF